MRGLVAWPGLDGVSYSPSLIAQYLCLSDMRKEGGLLTSFAFLPGFVDVLA
jgi:hypothetical protein